MQDSQQVYTAEYYQVRAYEADKLESHFRLLTDAIVSHLKPSRSLDIGCARGYFVAAQRKQGVAAHGLDVSHYAVNSCPSNVRDYLVQGNAEDKLPFGNAEFDVITCLECMEHLEIPKRAIAEASRVLKPMGYIVASSPKVTLWRRLFNFIFGGADVHPSEFSKDTWVALFKEHGLEYVGDFTELWGIAGRIRSIAIQHTYSMMPCLPIGQFMNRLGEPGKWLRVRLNILAWQPEYMLFRKVEV